MSSDGPPGDVLADVKVGVELKLAALWAATAFCYYGDFFRLMQPGKLAEMLAGRAPLGPVTPGLLLGFAMFMSIPAVMVFLSTALAARISRWANVILGAAEALLTAAIVWLAWTWPKSSRP